MAAFPHCNSEILHAPGHCYFCDKFPGAQRLRIAAGTPFSSDAANGWSGNVAVQEGEYHEHMGFGHVVGDPPQSFDRALQLLEGDTPCRINFKRGWRCTRRTHISGPCALVPKWWNPFGGSR